MPNSPKTGSHNVPLNLVESLTIIDTMGNLIASGCAVTFESIIHRLPNGFMVSCAIGDRFPVQVQWNQHSWSAQTQADVVSLMVAEAALRLVEMTGQGLACVKA